MKMAKCKTYIGGRTPLTGESQKPHTQKSINETAMMWGAVVIFYDKNISLHMWENICDIIQGAGTTERENYWAPYVTSSTKINSLIDFTIHS